MTSLERWKGAVTRGDFDRLPRFYQATEEFSQSLREYLGEDMSTILYDRFRVDERPFITGREKENMGPLYNGPPLKTYDDGSFDNIWGSRQREIFHREGKGSYIETYQYALAGDITLKDIEKHSWPRVEDYDFTPMKTLLDYYPDHPFMVGYWAVGWFSWEIRGMDQCFMDFLLEPELADALTTRVADIGIEYYKKLLRTIEPYIGKNVQSIHIADDWGMQDGLIMSHEIFTKFYAKHYKRFCDLAHSYGLKVQFHSCGAARELFPALIDLGVDIINPIQTSAKGMIPHELKKEFGKDVCFSGGVDVQQILPNETPGRVKEEVKYLMDTLGQDGGYIIGPAHNIQYGTPPENVVAMYEAMDEYS
jgi:uroporphyrinogen decarboxylase